MKSTLKRGAAALAALGAFSMPALGATPGNALVMAYNIDAISTFDPAQVAEAVTNEILSNICDALVNFDPKDETRFIPGLAQSWEASPDGLSITFRLGDGIVFPDGRPGTAQDVVWSMQRVLKMNFANSSTLTQWGFSKDNMAQSITAPDDKTVVLKFDKPYPLNLILGAIATDRVTYMLDRKQVEAHAKGDDMGNGWLNSNAACVGPYSLARWNQGEMLLLEANKNYGGQKPRLQRIIIRHVAETGTQRLMLEQGDVDVARNLTPEDLKAIEASKDMRVATTLSPSLFYMAMNNADPILANEKVRLAMRYLIDYQGLGSSVMQGIGVPRASFVQLGAFGALDEKEGQPFKLDIAKARQLLAEAGYPDGFTLSMIIGSHPYADPIAQTIQQAAAKAGVTFKIERMSNSQLFSKTRGRDFQAALLGFRASIPDAHGMASRHVFNPDNAAGAKQSQYTSWRSAYFDPQANAAVEAALLEKDPAKRAEMYHQLQRDQMQRGPQAYIMQTMNVAGMRNNVKDWTWNSFRVYYDAASK